MTKSEVKALRVSEKQELLKEYYEDPEGDFDRMTGGQLDAFIDDNWGELEELLAGDEEEEVESVEEDEKAEAEVETASDLSRPNPATDLYSGTLRA